MDSHLDALYNKACQLAEGGAIQEAIAEMRALLRIDPSYTRAWESLAILYLNSNITFRSLYAAFRALRQDPSSLKANIVLAVQYYHNSRLNDALRHSEKALAASPQDADALRIKITCLLDLGHPNACLAEISKLPPPLREDPIIQMIRASAYSDVGQTQAAFETIEALLDGHPNNPKVWGTAGGISYDCGDYSYSYHCYTKSTEIDPTSSFSWVGKGNSANDLGDRPDIAKHAFQNAIKLNQKIFTAWLGLGNCFNKLCDYNSAIDVFDTSIRLRATANAFTGKAIALKNLGQFDDAIAALYHAVSLNPSYANAWLQLGSIYIEQTRYFDAQRAWTRFLDMAKTHELREFVISEKFLEFCERFFAPALIYRICWEKYPEMRMLVGYHDTIRTAVNFYGPVSDLLSYIEASDNFVTGEDKFWLKCIVFILMGDPALVESTIQMAGLKLSSNIEFQYLRLKAIELQHKVFPEYPVDSFWEFISSKSSYSILDRYYISLMMYEIGKVEAALQWLPSQQEAASFSEEIGLCSLYIRLAILISKEGIDSPEELEGSSSCLNLIRDIFAQEKKIADSGRSGLINGTEVYEIDLTSNDWKRPFEKALSSWQVIDGLWFVWEWMEFKIDSGEDKDFAWLESVANASPVENFDSWRILEQTKIMLSKWRDSETDIKLENRKVALRQNLEDFIVEEYANSNQIEGRLAMLIDGVSDGNFDRFNWIGDLIEYCYLCDWLQLEAFVLLELHWWRRKSVRRTSRIGQQGYRNVIIMALANTVADIVAVRFGASTEVTLAAGSLGGALIFFIMQELGNFNDVGDDITFSQFRGQFHHVMGEKLAEASAQAFQEMKLPNQVTRVAEVEDALDALNSGWERAEYLIRILKEEVMISSLYKKCAEWLIEVAREELTELQLEELRKLIGDRDKWICEKVDSWLGTCESS